MEKIEALVKILTRIDEGESPAAIRQGSADFLSAAEAEDIVRAEQVMLNKGANIKDIARACRAHIDLIGHPAEKLRLSLPQGHVLQRLLSEHQMVQCLLVDLVKLNNAISKLRFLSATSEEYTRLLHILSHLSGGEQHIQIEEKTLFPELEKAGMAVLPTILSAEHFELRYHTQQLQELVYRCCTLDFDEFQRSLDRIVSYIVPLKQEHIFKEDNMLYPIAFGLIKEETAWRQLHIMWEQVGYSGF